MNIIEIERHVNRCGGCYIIPEMPDYGFQSGRGLVPLHRGFDWLNLHSK